MHWFLFSCVTVFYDTFQVVRFATKLLRLPLSERPLEVLLPATREREWGNYIVRWVRAHQDVATLLLAMQGSWLPSTATLMLRCVKWWLRTRVMRCIKSCSCPVMPIRRRLSGWPACTLPSLKLLSKWIGPEGFARTQLAFRWSVGAPDSLASKLVPRCMMRFFWYVSWVVEGAAVVPVGPESLRLSHCGSSFTIPVLLPPPFWYLSGAQLMTLS